MAVIADRSLTPGTRLTAVAIASHLNIKTGQLNPSARTLARETGQSERAIMRQLACLKVCGHLGVTSRHGRSTNQYRLLSPTLNHGSDQSSSNREPPIRVEPDTTLIGQSGIERSTLTGGSVNPDRPDTQPCPTVHTNLLNLEENLVPGWLRKFRHHVGDHEWKRIAPYVSYRPGPPEALIFQYEFQRSKVETIHGQKLSELRPGLELRTRSAAV
jgi:Helix-turn-helix domain